MQEYTLRIKEIEEPAQGTVAFKLEKPDGLSFKPGQYMSVYNSLEDSDSHTFSIAAAPHEDFLMFATRVRESSAFKNKLLEYTPGDKLKIKAAGGQFTLPSKKDIPITFLVGGIGITPVRSMLKHEEYKEVVRGITLFYSNRTPEETTFLHELENISLPDYRFVPTMTKLEDSKEEWNGETGYIDKKMIEKYVGDTSIPMFYIVGSPGFVEAMVNLLDSLENVPSPHIKSEDFAGY